MVGNSFSLTGPIVASPATARSVTFNQQTLGVYSQTVSGPADFTKTGAATLRLATPQTYTGDTYISQGILTVIPPSPAITSIPGLAAWFERLEPEPH